MSVMVYDPQIGKYGNKKVKTPNGEFDSKKEYNRYRELQLLERAGRITELRRQVKFVLIPTQYIGTGKNRRVAERECDYVADFVYLDVDSGNTVVEDVKGYRDPSSAGYAKFVIKRKLMLYLHGIRVEEI